MTKQKNKPIGWLCTEERTGACDGTYFDKADAEIQCEFKEVLWPGSKWNLEPDYHGGGSNGRYHREEPMYGRLIDRYGEPDYEAVDEWCKEDENK